VTKRCYVIYHDETFNHSISSKSQEAPLKVLRDDRSCYGRVERRKDEREQHAHFAQRGDSVAFAVYESGTNIKC